MIRWMTYKMPFNDKEMVICVSDDGSSVSGVASSMPDFQKWLAEGNTPEPWNPEQENN